MIITIDLTDTQYKGLEYIALSPEEWATNLVTERARIANDEIVKITVQYCLDNGIQLPTTREEIVAYAFNNGLAKTAAQIQAEAEAKMAALQAEAEAETTTEPTSEA